MNALADDEVRDGDDDGFLEAASVEVRATVRRVDDVLRDEIEEDAGDDEDLDDDDDDLEALLRVRRLRYWFDRLSPSEAAQALEHRLNLLVEAVAEFAAFNAMLVERHPGLREATDDAAGRLRIEIERIFDRLDRLAR